MTELNTAPGAVTRLTVNIGPHTAKALNDTQAVHGVTLTEALRLLVARGYAAVPEPARLPADATWQWGWRLAGVEGAVALPASEATARKQAELDPDTTEVVRRPVGEWEVVDRG